MTSLLNNINQYSQVEMAKNWEYFEDTTSAIYMWYFPIKFKKKVSSINESKRLFYEEDINAYNEVTKIILQDNRRKLQGEIKSFAPIVNNDITFIDTESETNSNSFSDLLLSLSTFSNPIYIGKASRETTVKKRIKEHIELTTTFSKSLDEKLCKMDLTMTEMIVRVIDVDRLNKEYYSEIKTMNFDFAEFIEKILINLFKPVFNIKN